MATVAGWKDILRPIRDGYRHLFPSPDTGPTPEERAKQRELDRLKGFAYFDTFDQLEKWTEASSDNLQRANTPLLRRPRVSKGHEVEKASLLICHDYAGNYHDYEACQNIGLDEESYSCQYLQYVETFIYFSHKLVCVPPPTWTNTLHRNGVEVLGTVLIEPQTKDIEKLLQHSKSAEDCFHFPLAKRLAALAEYYGFDGWLINIEKPFPKEIWNAHLLEPFLRQLRHELGPDRKLIWYDAITTANKIEYQNALTPQNLPFSEACGSILTNYCWTEAAALSSKELAHQQLMEPRHVFFGIDVWAQNTSKLTHPRVTYPKDNGGGTYTGIAVAKLAEIGLSAAIFAPAWTFEHFPGHGPTVERAVWDGYVLPEDLECSCGIGRQSKQHPFNRGYPVARFARQFPAGSEHFFYTDFTRAFGHHSDEDGRRLYDDKMLHSQVGAQSILPHVARSSITNDEVESAINVLSQRLEDLPVCSQLVVEVQSIIPLGIEANKLHERSLPLFQLDMPADGSLRFRAQLRCCFKIRGVTASFYLKFTNTVTYFALVEGEKIQVVEGAVQHDGTTGNPNRLQEIGIHLTAPQLPQETLRILEIIDICISPPTHAEDIDTCSIDNMRIDPRYNGGKTYWRLCWDYHVHESKALEKRDGLPHSRVTGPFSYFLVEIDGLSARAYALEWHLSWALVQLLSAYTEITVIGVGFDGRQLARCVARLAVPI